MEAALISVVVGEKVRRMNKSKKPFSVAARVKTSRYGGQKAKHQMPIMNGKIISKHNNLNPSCSSRKSMDGRC